MPKKKQQHCEVVMGKKVAGKTRRLQDRDRYQSLVSSALSLLWESCVQVRVLVLFPFFSAVVAVIRSFEDQKRPANHIVVKHGMTVPNAAAQSQCNECKWSKAPHLVHTHKL